MGTDERNLNFEQTRALSVGEANYIRSAHQTEVEKTSALLEGAFDALVKYVDEVSDKYYRLLFAKTVQAMQDLGVYDMSERAVSAKLDIFTQLLEDCQHPTEDDKYETLLTTMYVDLGHIFLAGQELARNDSAAYFMFDIARQRGSESAKAMLDRFKINADGKWQFTG